MIISKEDAQYILPPTPDIIYLVDTVHKDTLISLLQDYFGKKKKNACSVNNEQGESLTPKEYLFVDVPFSTPLTNEEGALLSNKPLSQIIEKSIEQNEDLFQSISKIRENIHELTTDKGAYKLNKMMSFGLERTQSISHHSIHIPSITNMIQLTQINPEFVYLNYINLVLFDLVHNQNEVNLILHIDAPVTTSLLKWISNWSTNRIQFLLTGTIQIEHGIPLHQINILQLSDKASLNTISWSMSQFEFTTYALHPFTRRNIHMQNQKIIEIFNLFNDQNTTFLIEFTRDSYSNTFI